MRVLLLGGSGFIGSSLAIVLAKEGYDVEILSRNPQNCSLKFRHPKILCSPWDGVNQQDLEPYVEGCDIVVNLLGEPIAGKQWTEEQKEILESSRVVATEALTKAVLSSHIKPKVVIQGSAVGFYGYDYIKNPDVDEYNEKGTGFLADLTERWEDAILPLEGVVQKLIVIRSGIVLDKKGGILSKLLPIYKFGLGGRIGTGLQPFSWITLKDEVAAIVFLIKNSSSYGVYNLVSPQITTNEEFSRALAKSLKRPYFMKVPEKAIRYFYGDQMADEFFLGGKFAVPARLQKEGFKFNHTSLETALREILR